MKNLRKIAANADLIIASGAFCLSIVIIVMNVTLRYLISKPIVEAEELSALAFVWIIFVGASAVYRKNGNISIDILVILLPGIIRKVIDILIKLILLIVNFYIVYLTVGLYESVQIKTTFVLRIPYTSFYLAIFLGYGFMGFYAIKNLGKSIKSLIYNKDKVG